MVGSNSSMVLVRPCDLKRKVMLVPFEDKDEFNLVVDYGRPSLPITIDDVRVPYYPHEGDMVRIKADEGYWYVKVVKIDMEAKQVRLKYYHYNTAGRLVESKEPHDVVSWDTVEGVL